MRSLVILLPLLLSFCQKDETISAFVPPQSIWSLVELNNQAFLETTTISFPEPGSVTGKGPCNSYSTTQTAPYPWFEITGIQATKMGCPSLAIEQNYFETLKNATFAETSGDTLILSNDSGPLLVFKIQ